MALVKFYNGTEEQIIKHAFEDGAIYAATDIDMIAYDIKDESERHFVYGTSSSMGKITDFSTEQPSIKNNIYYIQNEEGEIIDVKLGDGNAYVIDLPSFSSIVTNFLDSSSYLESHLIEANPEYITVSGEDTDNLNLIFNNFVALQFMRQG